MASDRRRRSAVAVVGVAMGVMLFAGCASGLDAGATPTPRASECAVAVNPEAPPPDGCTVYDPEDNMASNQRYRDRLDIGADAVAAGAPYVVSATAGLDELQSSGRITAEAVREVLRDSGLPADAIQTIGDVGGVEFGGMMPPEVGGPGVGVCLFGEVSADGVIVEVGGVVADGGCVVSRGGH